MKKRSGDGWIEAVRTPGTVIVNLGIMMERWTGEKYHATVSWEFRGVSDLISLCLFLL